MKKPTVVVALGGNALLRRGEPLEADIQRKNIATAAKTIARIAEDYNVVLKADVQRFQLARERDRLNLGIGYQF